MPYQNLEIKFPERFVAHLHQNTSFDYALVLDNLKSKLTEFISNGNTSQEFFKDYTNHGANHINEVLSNADFLIPAKTFVQLTANEIFYLTASVLLHDIALHIPWSVFHSLINGSNDQLKLANQSLDRNCSWRDEFEKYLKSEQSLEFLDKPIFWEPNDKERRIIGEFIRKNHHRFAFEIAEIGLMNPGTNNYENLFFPPIRLEERKMIGTIARSHNHSMVDPALSEYMIQHFKDTDRPFGVRIKYLMSIISILLIKP
jgi:hypothetical protein